MESDIFDEVHVILVHVHQIIQLGSKKASFSITGLVESEIVESIFSTSFHHDVFWALKTICLVQSTMFIQVLNQ
jgi:hypothetical protein